MFGTYTRLNLTTSASNCDVIRAARLKIAEHHRTGREARAARHRFYRDMLFYHERSRALVGEWRL
ncbi:hypothetical protein [Microvirga brassicacearum]|uniref:Uncharacterized protein n=1 Tax=Microvirga brassicacearum TaxID=2580413 RepID=A0A5N3PH62_9HYPH|nr:hypothetical protein [Microvirga brassicacearum]KAB0269049.1 hypothetical protein FEZ63_02775 [Microvirga brassicacearum]